MAMDTQTFSRLVDLSVLSTLVWDQAGDQNEDYLGQFFKSQDTETNSYQFAEMGPIGYAREKQQGVSTVYEDPSQGGLKTVTLTTFMLGMKFYRELVRASPKWPVALRGVARLRRSQWAMRQLRMANMWNNATATTGRYVISDGVAEGWASTTHSVGVDSGTQSNQLSAAAFGYTSSEDAEAGLYNQVDAKGIPLKGVIRWAVASSSKVRNAMKLVFDGRLAAMQKMAPTVVAGDAVVSGQNRSHANVVGDNNPGVIILDSPFFDRTTSWWSVHDADHGFVELKGDALEFQTNLDFDSGNDLKMWGRSSYEIACFKWRGSQFNASS